MEVALAPAVIEEARRRRRRRRIVRLAGLAAGSVVAVTLALGPSPWSGSGGRTAGGGSAVERAAGPWKIVAAGADWNLVLRPGTPGRLCDSYGAPGWAENGCFAVPAELLPIPLIMGGAYPDRDRIVGLSSTQVARVSLVLATGLHVSARTHEVKVGGARFGVYTLDFRSRLFIFGGKVMGRLLAYDAHGRAVAHRRL